MNQSISKYLELTKPKVTLLNLLVGVTCFLLAAFPAVDLLKLAVFAFVGYLAAGGCGVLNSVYDQDIDRLMDRTLKRAIPAGKVTTNKATAMGAIMIATSIAFSYFFFNMLTGLMMILGTVFYLCVYTVWLKRISPWNVVIGGFAGCFAALSGWTAAANGLSLMPLLVAMLDFFWTPGHLWGLAIKKVKEYQKAGVPMLPVTIGITGASKIVFWLNVTTVAVSFFLLLSNLVGILYLAFAATAGIGFLVQSGRLLASPSKAHGFKVFLFSMPYLTCLMLGLIIDKILLI